MLTAMKINPNLKVKLLQETVFIRLLVSKDHISACNFISWQCIGQILTYWCGRVLGNSKELENSRRIPCSKLLVWKGPWDLGKKETNLEVLVVYV